MSRSRVSDMPLRGVVLALRSILVWWTRVLSGRDFTFGGTACLDGDGLRIQFQRKCQHPARRGIPRTGFRGHLSALSRLLAQELCDVHDADTLPPAGLSAKT